VIFAVVCIVFLLHVRCSVSCLLAVELVGSRQPSRLFFLFVWIGLQPVLHQQVYHGIFTEVSTDLESFTSVIQAVCYYEIVSGFGCIKLALEVCGRYF
jgi:hypothetical protein